jgi:predicted aspartyl protease
MISGVVNANLEARVGLFIEDGSGHLHAFDAAIDTGFTGWMCLPPALIASLGLAWLHYRDVQLVKGSVVRMEVYSGAVIWDTQARTVDVFFVRLKLASFVIVA